MGSSGRELVRRSAATPVIIKCLVMTTKAVPRTRERYKILYFSVTEVSLSAPPVEKQRSSEDAFAP